MVRRSDPDIGAKVSIDEVEAILAGRIADRLTQQDAEALIREHTKGLVTADTAKELLDAKFAALGPDEIWKVVESKVKDRLFLLKALFYVSSAFVTLFTGAIVWLITDSDIRSHLVSKWVVDVQQQLAGDSLVDAYKKFLDKPSVAKKYDEMFDARFNSTMQHVVAYSYSSVFHMGNTAGQKKYHSLPFYRTSDDKGRLECTAIYPSEEVRNLLYLTWNDTGEQEKFTFDEEP